VIECCLFEYADAETGLAGARHADDDCVRRQVLGIVKNQVLGKLVRFHVVALAKIERAEFLEIVHIASLAGRVGVTCTDAQRQAYREVDQ
jgi:hypothetical protein